MARSYPSPAYDAIKRPESGLFALVHLTLRPGAALYSGRPRSSTLPSCWRPALAKGLSRVRLRLECRKKPAGLVRVRPIQLRKRMCSAPPPLTGSQVEDLVNAPVQAEVNLPAWTLASLCAPQTFSKWSPLCDGEAILPMGATVSAASRRRRYERSAAKPSLTEISSPTAEHGSNEQPHRLVFACPLMAANLA